MLDPIADMLTRVRNAQAAGRASVVLNFSSVKEIIAQILVREGYASRVEKSDEDGKPSLTIWLRYEQVTPTQKKPAITEIDRVSKEGCRIYIKRHDIEKVKNGYGIAIVSTSQGIMTGREAYRKGLGGEYICKVW
ncbi:MAG: 30S ribosomal protein S8 [Candidatus Moranbacteria bacterium]|jgi:small subunit ribosomal protein S8|nr:30S ribosomal protein S8 [Candidatus Moranbacteria bacterium]MBP9801159.1 30S ribosomal protein S8 [Candidatus Moranbacteria bacterium]